MTSILSNNPILSKLIEKVVGENNDRQYLVNKLIEEKTGCTIHNKNEILKRSDNMNDNEFIQEVVKNILPNLNFNKFKEMGFSIIFVNDDVYVLYNNMKVNSSIVDTLQLESKDKPQYPELYIENIKTVIDKFNNLDVSIIYNCSNIDSIYWNLFDIKARKRYPNYRIHLDANKHFEDIVSGAIYQNEDTEMQDIMKQIKTMEENYSDSFSDSDEKYESNDEVFKLEVLSYLNDDSVNNFLTMDENVSKIKDNVLDYNNKEQVVTFISQMLDINNSNDLSTLGKIYFTNNLFKFILKCKKFLKTNPMFMATVKNKINELEHESTLIKFAKINLTYDFIKTLKTTNELIASIEKELNSKN